MKVLAGLGNPGLKYARTRHNVGFWTIDRLAEKYNIKVRKPFLRALTGEITIGGEKVLLAKPQTYMNASGKSLSLILNWYKLTPEDLVVIYDDMDLPPGTIRLRPRGGSGGHKGIASVMEEMNSRDFCRLRIGIGKPEEEQRDTISWVLGKFTPEEKKAVEEAVDRGAQALETFVEKGVNTAMNFYNG